MSGWPVGLDAMHPVDKDGGTERCKVSVITGNNSNYQTLEEDVPCFGFLIQFVSY